MAAADNADAQRWLARILLKQGLVTPAQLDECLARQRQLAAQGGFRSLSALLQEQGYLEAQRRATLLEAEGLAEIVRQDVLYGKIALKNGFVPRAELSRMLSLQEDEGYARRIGEMLLADGHISEARHRSVLRALEQHLDRSEALLGALGDEEDTAQMPAAGPIASLRLAPAAEPRRASSPREPPSGRQAKLERVGPYVLLEPIGEGGLSTVFLARDAHSGERVAVKLLRSDVAVDADFLARLHRREAGRVFAHRNLVRVLGSGSEGGRHYLAMEFIDGGPLSRVAALPPGETIKILKQTARGLAVMHRSGVVHRDIKPSNIMIGRDGWVRIMDFGLAKSAKDEDVTRHAQLVGTSRYMAPEQFQKLPLDGRADVFALGIVAYEYLAGREPFGGADILDYYQANCFKTAPSLMEVQPGLPAVAQCDHVVQGMLARRPAERFDAAAALRALGELQTAMAASRG